MAKIRIRTHANPLSYPNPIERKEWAVLLNTQNGASGREKRQYSDGEHICLDMGCGQGDFIITSAKNYPEKKYVGIEVRKSMCNKVNEKIKEEKITNAICVQGNASISLKTMFYTSEVNEIVINFPDPWFKEKHKKRLMIRENAVRDMYEILMEEGIIYLQTDVEEVFNMFKEALEKRFIAVEYQERAEKSYWEKHHEEKGTKIYRSCFVKE